MGYSCVEQQASKSRPHLGLSSVALHAADGGHVITTPSQRSMCYTIYLSHTASASTQKPLFVCSLAGALVQHHRL